MGAPLELETAEEGTIQLIHYMKTPSTEWLIAKYVLNAPHLDMSALDLARATVKAEYKDTSSILPVVIMHTEHELLSLLLL